MDKNSWIDITSPLNSYYQPRCDDIYVTSTNAFIVLLFQSRHSFHKGLRNSIKQATYLNENKQFRIEIKICKEDLWIIHVNDPFV